MSNRGGQPGNQNARKGKDWETALRYALNNYEDGKVARGQALREIGKAVVLKAIEGDMVAVKEIGDRLDGKPVMSVDGSGALFNITISRDDVGL